MKTYTYVCKTCGSRTVYGSLTQLQLCHRCGTRDTIPFEEDEGDLEYKRPHWGGGADHVVFRPEKITAGKHPKAIWQKCEDKLYLTCPGCTGIVDVTLDISDIREKFVLGCIVCPICQTHFWAYLKDYPVRKPRKTR